MDSPQRHARGEVRPVSRSPEVPHTSNMPKPETGRSHEIKMRDESGLTNREMECLYWASRGKNTTETAIILGISYWTVRWYLKQVREKLDCCTVTQAIAQRSNIHGERYDRPHHRRQSR
jgi:DNA-binding CsgD family transcriptional regulator